jgi:ABC-2 type transport system ATP-binding protein
MSSPIIQCINLGKTYDKNSRPVLHDLNMEVQQGEIVGIFGPNGAGKTTLISILCSILEPSTGEATYYLPEKLSPKEVRKHLGFVPQDFAFFPELTAYQNLRYFGNLYALPTQALEQQISSLLQKVGLFEVRNKKVSSFSGGMKRRLNLIISLLHQPQLLFLDEPTVGIDVQSKLAIIELLQELNRGGVTIIYTSHHLKEAEDFCNRIILLDHGKIVANNQLENLLQEYAVSNLEDLILNLTGKELRD